MWLHDGIRDGPSSRSVSFVLPALGCGAWSQANGAESAAVTMAPKLSSSSLPPPSRRASPSVCPPPGQTLTFHLRAYELTGEGMMQWAPDHHHVVAYWDTRWRTTDDRVRRQVD